MQEKAFVEGIYNESLRRDRISKGLANTLNILTKTVFGEANRFVFELLQNADDAPKTNGSSELRPVMSLMMGDIPLTPPDGIKTISLLLTYLPWLKRWFLIN